MKIINTLFLGFFLLAGPFYSIAQCTIDQRLVGTDSRPSTINEDTANGYGQSFRASISGQLSSVGLDLSATNASCSGNMNIRIDILDGDTIRGTQLASEVFTRSLNFTRTLDTFRFSNPASLVAGQMYTLRVSLTPGQKCGGNLPQLIWYFQFPTNYWAQTGGKCYQGGFVGSLGNTHYFFTCMSTCTNTTSSISPVACDSYTSPSGKTFTSSASFNDTIPNSGNCDSIITINLTINNTDSFTVLNESACFSYRSPSGKMWSNSGTYMDTIATMGGCDSIITINLSIDTVETGVSNASPVLTALATGASYQWLDCDNAWMPLAGDTNQSFTATSNGSFAVEVTQNGCVDTSNCEDVTGVFLLENSFSSEIKLYPNPGNGRVNLELPASHESIEVMVRNLVGQEISRKQFSGNSLSFEIEAASGIYFLEVQAGAKHALLKVIKE